MSHQQTETMTGLHYSIVSEKMVWIWYYDDFGGKHLKELLTDDAVAFVRREGEGKESGSGFIGTDFFKTL
ncbi:hypothetical protein [Dyadobacter sp. OTU695]|uniref:hypothetical protein n=1 Tax=Dyadobacter sp. OTU695 TaxID=3043860 RepID=UPI00313CC860